MTRVGDEAVDWLGEDALDAGVRGGLRGGLRDGLPDERSEDSLSLANSEKRLCRAQAGFHGGRGLPSERARERGLAARGLPDILNLLIGLTGVAVARLGRAGLTDRGGRLTGNVLVLLEDEVGWCRSGVKVLLASFRHAGTLLFLTSGGELGSQIEEDGWKFSCRSGVKVLLASLRRAAMLSAPLIGVVHSSLDLPGSRCVADADWEPTIVGQWAGLVVSRSGLGAQAPCSGSFVPPCSPSGPPDKLCLGLGIGDGDP